MDQFLRISILSIFVLIFIVLFNIYYILKSYFVKSNMNNLQSRNVFDLNNEIL